MILDNMILDSMREMRASRTIGQSLPTSACLSFYQGDNEYARETHSYLLRKMTFLPPKPWRMPRVVLCLLVIVTLAALFGCTTHIQPVGPSEVSIEADRASDVRVTATDKRLVLDVTSERGIGHANVTLPAGHEYDEIEIHLHLRGLEQFVLAHGNEQIVAAATGADSASHQLRTVNKGNVISQTELALDSPYRIDIEQIEIGGELEKNARQRVYVIRLPVTSDFGRAFSVRWVDFLRQ